MTRLLLLAAIGWPVLAFGACGAASWREAWKDAERELSRSAATSAEHVQRVLDGMLLRTDLANLLVAGLSDAEITAEGVALRAALRELATRRQAPATIHLSVHGAENRPLLNDEGADAPASPGLEAPPLRLGQVETPQGPEPRIMVTRRREASGSDRSPGEGGGLILATMRRDALDDGLDRLGRAGSGDVIALWRQDGEMLARSRPAEASDSGALEERRAVQGWPAFVTATRPRAAILAQWRDATLVNLAFGSPAALALLFLAVTMRRRDRALAVANQALARKIEEGEASHLQAGRQQAEVLASMREVIYALDADLRFAFVSRRALEVWGRADEDLLGQPFLDLFPKAAGSLSFQAQLEAMAERRETHLCVVSPVIGHWIEVDIYPRAGGGVIVAFRDIEDLRAAQRQTATAERRLRLATAAGRLGTFAMDLTRGTVTRSGRAVPEGPRLPVTDLPLHVWTERVHPEDRDAVQQVVAEVTAGRRLGYQIEYRIRTADDLPWQVIESHAVVADRDLRTGRPLLLVGVSRDVTQERAAEARQRLMAREVDHRAKNALAVVQAALRLTPRHDAAAFARAVEGRVAALARAHTALAEGRWQSAALRVVAEAELSVFHPVARSGTARITLDGPDLALAPEAVQALSMTLHELATNAAKHGALSTPEGRLSVTWEVERGTEVLRLEWRERGGPAVAGPPTRRGFGSRLVATTVEHQLGGTVQRCWAEGGLVCRITVPLERIRAHGDAPVPPV
ncbi:PAS domain-containing protein [Roseomonas frigidaquae]|uniref:histidine kinase n=1 Tax=Falsiroseomonas frigidaquae TaxID=487318 RepID=A0ABX1F701_9PROT|nr:HWE histidine kinase domain-containing protein [Falsiroseomonas frigidaquae]NKE48001.1 PAS domain-containing protein [Falsiroseomonas frigidaquae]